MTGKEARAWYVSTLLDKVRADRYPSATQMRMIEESIPREQIPEYLEVLLEKVGEDKIPSIPMMRRIQRVADSLP